MPEGWVHPFFMRLHRVVLDETLTRWIETVLEADAASGRHIPIPRNLRRRRYLQPAELGPILTELERRKQLGLPYEEAAETLEQEIARDEAAFWKPVRATQRAGYLYSFGELGIETRLTVDQMIAAMRSSADRHPREELAVNDQYIYGLTHVVLTRSRYYRSHVDPAEFEFAIPVLRAALAYHYRGPSSIQTYDAISSVLSALMLLRVSEGPLIKDARARLIDEQNTNGSWGSKQGAGRSKSHATLNGVLAIRKRFA